MYCMCFHSTESQVEIEGKIKDHLIHPFFSSKQDSVDRLKLCNLESLAGEHSINHSDLMNLFWYESDFFLKRELIHCGGNINFIAIFRLVKPFFFNCNEGFASRNIALKFVFIPRCIGTS